MWRVADLRVRLTPRADRDAVLGVRDGVVQGGSYDKTYLGINWWATRRWKLGFGWGRTWLDRFSTTGHTDSFLTRIQWVY